MSDLPPTYAGMAEFFRVRFGNTVRTFTVQEDDKDVAGMLVIDGEITNLAVDEDLRKQGIATALINMAKARYSHLTLVCHPSLASFYEKHGFTFSSAHRDGVGYRMDWSKP